MARLPAVIDIQPTGSCPWACPGCWGADHRKAGSLTPDEWLALLADLRGYGVEAITVTGGEPEVYPGIEELIVGAKALGLRITLSTVGVDLLERPRVLASLDDLGVPLDDATLEGHRAMRPLSHRFRPSAGAAVLDAAHDFQGAIRCLKRVPSRYPHIDLTLRTVVAKRNGRGVLGIPAMLVALGVDLRTIRWKVYELNPYLALTPVAAAQRLRLPEAELDALAPEIVTTGEAAGFRSVEVQRVAASAGRYFFLDPDARAFAVVPAAGGGVHQVHVADARHGGRALARRLEEVLPGFVDGVAQRAPSLGHEPGSSRRRTA